MSRHLVAVMVMLVGTSTGVQGARALPPNTHQVPEGYWIGGAPVTAADIEDLYAHGVRVIVSGVVMAEEPRQVCRRLGIERVNVWFGCHFPSQETLMEGTADHEPSQIFIHCDYGGDRAGAVLAFLLAVRHGWRPDHAILAVAYPGRRDVERLIAVLEENGLQITPEERESYTGIYSGSQNGGTGGLKVRGEDYQTLVISTLEAMAAAGIPIVDPQESPAVVDWDGPAPPATEEATIVGDDPAEVPILVSGSQPAMAVEGMEPTSATTTPPLELP